MTPTPDHPLPASTHRATQGGPGPDHRISWLRYLLSSSHFPNCKREPELFLEPTWVSDSGNYTFSCSLTQRNMSSDCPPNVPSPPNGDRDKVAHSSAMSRILFDIFGEQRKGKERWDHSGSERARAGKATELHEEETDLCNNVLAEPRQCPHVRKAGLYFTDKSGRVMHRNCRMVQLWEPNAETEILMN